MKTGIHPKYGKTVVKCACGNTFETGSTKEKLHVDICSQCHPYITGNHKIIDSGGRVEMFNKRYANRANLAANVSKASKKEDTTEAASETK